MFPPLCPKKKVPPKVIKYESKIYLAVTFFYFAFLKEKSFISAANFLFFNLDLLINE